MCTGVYCRRERAFYRLMRGLIKAVRMPLKAVHEIVVKTMKVSIENRRVPTEAMIEIMECLKAVRVIKSRQKMLVEVIIK